MAGHSEERVKGMEDEGRMGSGQEEMEHSAIHATVNREKMRKGEKEGNKNSPP